jgi:glyceraldehyde 3-phosphate dehydrogenase (phosphorylating)
MPKVQVFENKKPIVGINGLGRIGKLTLWHHVGRRYFHEIVINTGREVGTDFQAMAQYIAKDTTYGPLHRFLHGIKAKQVIEIVDEKAGKMLIDGIPVLILREARNPGEINWRNYGIDLVVECTGKFRDPTLPPDSKSGSIRGHLAAGAKVVINSSPFKIKDKALSPPDDTVTLIYGINHNTFDKKHHQVVSAASCTTTGLAHMVKPLLEHGETNKILTASMSTVHAVTNSQSVLDSVPKAGEKDLRKNRSVLNNIILTSTNAAEALTRVIPEVKNIGFMADSIRVPINTESLIVLNITFQSRRKENGTVISLSANTLNEIYQKAQARDRENLLVFTMEQNVSGDLIGSNAAIVIEGQFNHTRTAFIEVDLKRIPGVSRELLSCLESDVLRVPVVHAKIFGWYDNEYGSFTNRLGDLTLHVHKHMG